MYIVISQVLFYFLVSFRMFLGSTVTTGETISIPTMVDSAWLARFLISLMLFMFMFSHVYYFYTQVCTASTLHVLSYSTLA